MRLTALDELGLYSRSLYNIEGGLARNLFVDQLLPFCAACRVAPSLMLGPDWTASPPLHLAQLNGRAVHDRLRAELRAARGARGTPSVASAAGMSQSTLVRWESGEYARLDTYRLLRLCEVLNLDVVAVFRSLECTADVRDPAAGQPAA